MHRRHFLSQVSATPSLFALGQSSTGAPDQPPRGPRRHSQDAWLDASPRSHRVVFDTWMADKFGEAVGFAGNWLRYQKEAYELADNDLAVVIVVRHGTTPFAFNEAMWAKYGEIFAENMSTNNKPLHPNPTTNRFATQLTNQARSGMRLAVCNVTTRAYTDIIAKQTGKSPADIREELTSNVLANAVLVPAGIIAFTRAQEYGYAAVSIG
jgi:hypothetical protein